MRRTTLTCLLLMVCFTISGAIAPCFAELPSTKLLVNLPDYVPTPDGMEVAANGDLVVACPNYGDSKQPACIIRITPELKVSKWITVQMHLNQWVQKSRRMCSNISKKDTLQESDRNYFTNLSKR